MLVYSRTKWPVTITFHGPVQYCNSSSSLATFVTISSQTFSQSAFCTADSLTFSLWHRQTLTCRAAFVPWGVTVNHPSGSQVNLPGCQMCHIGVLPGVKSPHYRPKAKPRKWTKVPPSLFPVPHDLLTSLCSLCTWMPQSPILGCNNRTTFNQAHQHSPYFLQAMDLLLPVNPLVLPTLSWAFFARFPPFPSILRSQWKEEKGWRGACE